MGHPPARPLSLDARSEPRLGLGIFFWALQPRSLEIDPRRPFRCGALLHGVLACELLDLVLRRETFAYGLPFRGRHHYVVPSGWPEMKRPLKRLLWPAL